MPGTCTSVTCSLHQLALRRGDFQFESVSAIPVRAWPSCASAFFQHVFDGALHVERLLGEIVVLAVDDLLEAADGVGQLHVLARAMPVNCSATWNGCERKRWILRARATVSLSSSDSSSMPRMAMMSCRSL